MPYEEISQEEYRTRAAGQKPIDFSLLYEKKDKTSDPKSEKFCDNDSCEI